MPAYRPLTSQSAAGPSVARDRQADALAEFRARRLQRKLEDLERTNPTDIPASSFAVNPPPSSASTLTTSLNPAVQSKKKQSGNVRKILYARKSLKDWLEELPPEPKPPYLLAVAPPPSMPPRGSCSSCGYVGAYKCPRCGEWSCDRNCMGIHERDGGCGVGW
ncbi:hypothetical protein BD324DRAFT_619928 [Kockovaella imperatae]|uniref:HIT-type domain-containing protein n=1 Tax=Kockovaella imperatae TaxID=4999 RepID=A0A1Y1UKX7_9TREE|nr:hypothetical protein BD324DRAFT_619928 [Kockovaella imperatae]ORX38197.1 hypothetical protein BD324DRAFT_619928 [Kockovaella imperatae]